jgi:hypothetical protein
MIMFMQICTSFFIHNRFPNRILSTQDVLSSRRKLPIFMVSVSGTPSAPEPQGKPGKAFIISPSLNSAEAEMIILQNFNQIQRGDSSKVGILGTNNLSEEHRQMVELLSYALVLSGNHIYTSGGGNGTNIAAVRGALRACNPDLLTVVLPQSLFKQPPEIQPLLSRVANLVQQPEYDDLELKEAAAICNEQIISMVDKILVFAYHDSTTILNAVAAVDKVKGHTIFYLD